MRQVHLFSAIEALVMMGVLIVSGTSTVYAAVACGDSIMSKTKLESNLDCTEYEGDALVIGADDVTIDLNGYTIISNKSEHAAIFGDGFSRLTIKNGAIYGFQVGVLLFNTSKSKIKRLTLMQQSTDGIAILDSRHMSISDVQASMLPLTVDGETVGVFLFGVNQASVERVSTDGSFYGLMSIDGTKNHIKDNNFSSVGHVGIRLIGNTGSVIEMNQIIGELPHQCYSAIDVIAPKASTRIQILNNTLSKCAHGVFVVNNLTDPPVPPSRNISIRDNHISEAADGVRLIRLQDSEVVGNHLHFNDAGIVLIEDSLNNRITENIATGNVDWDMFHDESSTPNLWQDNTCVNAEGEDIDCP